MKRAALHPTITVHLTVILKKIPFRVKIMVGKSICAAHLGSINYLNRPTWSKFIRNCILKIMKCPERYTYSVI